MPEQKQTTDHEAKRAKAAAAEAARKMAEAAAAEDVAAMEERQKAQPEGVDSSDDKNPDLGALPGHASTLKQWEDSAEGKAYIDAVGGERQTAADDEA